MKLARLFGLVLAVIMALNLAVASAAGAALPEFSPTGATLSASGGGTALSTASGELATCEKDTLEGSATVKAFSISSFRLHFLGCRSAGPSLEGCTPKSTNTSIGGLILTTTLRAIAVLDTTSSKNIVTGIIVLPVSGHTFATLAGNECTLETTVTGEVLGEPSPLRKKTTTGKVFFTTTKELEVAASKYEDGEASGSHEYKGLTAFTERGYVDGSGLPTFSSAVELT